MYMYSSDTLQSRLLFNDMRESMTCDKPMCMWSRAQYMYMYAATTCTCMCTCTYRTKHIRVKNLNISTAQLQPNLAMFMYYWHCITKIIVIESVISHSIKIELTYFSIFLFC